MKIIAYLFSILALAFIWNCTDDPYSPKDETPALNFEFIGKDSLRTRYSVNKTYLLKVKLKNDYSQFDSVQVTALYKSSSNTTIKFYNDGVSPDLIPNNNVWTGYFTPTINNNNNQIQDSLVFMAKVFIGSEIKTTIYRKDINCKTSFPPVLRQIIGITNGSALDSNFKALNIIIKADDEDNLTGNFDPLRAYIMLYDSTNTVKKTDSVSTYLFDSLKFNYRIDSTYAAGLYSSAKYRVKTFVKDSYYEKSDTLTISNFKIRNTKPVISDLLCDSTVIITGASNTDFFISFKVKDRQGLGDIDENITGMNVTRIDTVPNINQGFVLFYNDGTHDDLVANDNIFSRRFVSNISKPRKFKYSFFTTDKAGNKSKTIDKFVTYIKPTTKQFKGIK